MPACLRDGVKTGQFMKDLEASSSRIRNGSLFVTLKHKMQVASGEVEETECNVLKKIRHTAGRRDQSNATNNTRGIELGWMSNGKVLRTSNGSGTREIVVPNERR